MIPHLVAHHDAMDKYQCRQVAAAVRQENCLAIDFQHDPIPARCPGSDIGIGPHRQGIERLARLA
jgi:hypothetical protein